MTKNNAIYKALPALLLPWFSENARELPWRRDKNPYHVWISEIMLQQTRVEAVRGYFLRFLEAFPDVATLAAADEDAVLKLWEGLGYYSRARNLRRAAQLILEKYNGQFPETHKDILSLPGVGEYTAGAISSICFEKPEPAVDGNVLRVSARLTDSHSPIDLPIVKKEVTASLRRVYPLGHCGNFTQSLMELGATVCIPKSPRCSQCPLSGICLAQKRGTAASLPVKIPKRTRRIDEKTVFFLQCGERIAVRKREKKGLLAGLWEFPNVPGRLSPDEAVRQAEAWGAAPEAPERALERVHIFTHAEWHMICFVIPCRNMPPRFTWASPAQFRTAIALPTAFRIFLEGIHDTKNCI
ncbi:MAG: A/G-specific adenine glycosylase [Ruminococcaceae bacterium]|nr:A/G-specific adenine glycosylase [Oscillospiraceae bacterium]